MNIIQIQLIQIQSIFIYHKMQEDFYAFTNIEKLFPNFWTFIHPKEIKRQGIYGKQLSSLNQDIDMLFISSLQDVGNLMPEHQAVVKHLENIYVKKSKQLMSDPQYICQLQMQAQYQQQNMWLYQQKMQYQQMNTDPNAYYNVEQSQFDNNQFNNQNAGYDSNQNQFNAQNQGYPINGTGQTHQNYGSYYPQQHGNYGYHNNHQGGHQQGSHQGYYKNQENHTKYVQKSSLNENIEALQPLVNKNESISTANEEKVPPVVEKKVEPVKLEKKKLSIDQIRKLIANVTDKDELKKSVNPKLIEQIEEVNKWPKNIQQFEPTKQAPREYKNYPQNKNYKKASQVGKPQAEINKGSKYTKAPSQAAPVFDIQIGKNQNLQTKLVKNQLRKKAAQGDFAEKKQKQQQNLDKILRNKRQILLNLNKVAPQNLKDIFKQMEKYALEDEQVCVALVQSIIEKAWEQPKYAASYAKLSSYFGKIDSNRFKFNFGKKKSNPFKYFLIEKVQHSFDKKHDKKENVKEQEDKQKVARQKKNLIMGNVKFIAELIKIKLISKGIIRYCISNLISNFFENRYTYFKQNNTENNYYEYCFEALIEFLQNLGEKFEEIDKIDEKAQKGQKGDKQQETANKVMTPQKFKEIEKKIKTLCELSQKPPADIQGFMELNTNQYFGIFNLISTLALNTAKDGKRLGALLQNLEQRRAKGWVKHNVQSEGPKKLKDLNKQEETPEQKAKNDLLVLDEKMSKLQKKWVDNNNKQALQDLQYLLKKYHIEQVVAAFLKYIADEKKDLIPKRLELFNILIEKHLKDGNFKEIWRKGVESVSLLTSQYPFCQATLAKALIEFVDRKKGKYSDYFIEFSQDQQDEYYFMDGIFQKLYHYTQSEQVKKFITPKPKLTHIL